MYFLNYFCHLMDKITRQAVEHWKDCIDVCLMLTGGSTGVNNNKLSSDV